MYDVVKFKNLKKKKKKKKKTTYIVKARTGRKSSIQFDNRSLTLPSHTRYVLPCNS